MTAQSAPRRVEVRPEAPHYVDLLIYARTALDVFDWRQGPRANDGGDENLMTVATEEGLSLHDAIALAGQRLSSPREERTGSDYKGGGTSATGETLRTEATRKVMEVANRPKGRVRKSTTFNDMTWNDQLPADTGKDEVLRVLDTTITEATRA